MLLLRTGLEKPRSLSLAQENALAREVIDRVLLERSSRPVASSSPPIAALPPPVTPLAGRKKIKRLLEIPTEPQMASLFAAIDSARDQAIFRLMYHAGLRASEIGLLKMSDYSAKTGRLTVNRVHGSRSGTHPLNEEEARALKAWIKLRGSAPGVIFPSNKHRPISRQMLDTLVKHYGATAGWPTKLRHCHTFKHACCRHLLNKGFNVEQVQDWVGHVNIQNTILYSRITRSSREQMRNALADWK